MYLKYTAPQSALRLAHHSDPGEIVGGWWHAICGVALTLVYHQYTSGQSALQLSHLSALEVAWATERTTRVDV